MLASGIEEEKKETPKVQREVLQGRERYRMNKYIKKKCGLAFVIEKDSEADSWCKQSVAPNVEKTDLAKGFANLPWKDVLKYKGEIGPDVKRLFSPKIKPA